MMIKRNGVACVLAAAVLVACAPAGPPARSDDGAGATAPARQATPSGPALKVAPWPLPVVAGVATAQPDLTLAPDGSLLLSWIERRKRGHALHFARHAGGHWSAARQVAQGEDWFVNWADTPHIAATADGAVWAHWLRKSAQSTYAYDVVLARSGDGGQTWSAPIAVNTDGKPVEHGFVALWPQDATRLGVAWLDGRDTGADAAAHDAHAGHEGGAMSLRAASFDADLQRRGEARLDASTCDCCQTDVAASSRGPLVVYRDRAKGEIRDIASSRLQADGWTAPRMVHADGWRMPACPVNGPAVAARDAQVVVAWYTGAGEEPALKIARSTDAGDHFAAPVVVDRGGAVQGRVDVALGPDAAWVLWLREDARGQSLHLARYASDLSRELQRVQVARLQGRGRGTGLPQLALVDDRAYLAWTDIVDQHPHLRGVVVTVP